MEFRLLFKVGYFSIGADYLLRLSSFLTAILHAEKRGFGEKDMAGKGLCRVLYKLDLQIYRYPEYREDLMVVTRLGGRKSFKAYRYFQVLCGDEVVASALSVWLSLDKKSRKPEPVKGTLAERLFPEGLELPEPPPVEWKPEKLIKEEWTRSVTIRCADFDTNSHVNNAVYADYLETAISRKNGLFPRLKSYKIKFNHEIDMATEEVTVALGREKKGWKFEITSKDMVFAGGEVFLQ